jgi:hypothetical protein
MRPALWQSPLLVDPADRIMPTAPVDCPRQSLPMLSPNVRATAARPGSDLARCLTHRTVSRSRVFASTAVLIALVAGSAAIWFG